MVRYRQEMVFSELARLQGIEPGVIRIQHGKEIPRVFLRNDARPDVTRYILEFQVLHGVSAE